MGGDERDDTSPGSGSGRGGTMGAPSWDASEAAPSTDQEANFVVSGGGVAGPDDGEPNAAATSSPSASDPD